MSDKSPLFVSAVELLAHASELYSQGNERKFKFVILHLANAVELILKDRLIDKGVSIYQTKKSQTVGIWECFDELEKVNVAIPERPVIELLIDDRNTIQHRFGFPNAETVYYYLERTVAFFKRFFSDEYGVDLHEVLKIYLSDQILALIGLAERKEDEYASLDKLFELSPESAVLETFNLIEKKFLKLTGTGPSFKGRPIMFHRSPEFMHLLDDLAIEGFISKEAAQKFDLLRQMRNQAAHAAHFENVPSPEWREALKIGKEILAGMDKAAQQDFYSKWKAKHGIDGYSDDEADEDRIT